MYICPLKRKYVLTLNIMNYKNIYETPVVEAVELIVEAAVLTASTESSIPEIGE